MSKLVFYLGAGASIGDNNSANRSSAKSLGVKDRFEGVPVVSELSDAFEEFKEMIELTRIPLEGIEVLGSFLSSSEIESERREILEGLGKLIPAIRQHATIDTYAKKLWLTNNYDEYNKVKKLLSLFLIWSQLMVKPDSRYDTMLASLLSRDTLKFPKMVSVITWNYDSQFELAYRAYSSGELGVFDIFDSTLDLDSNSGHIYKINGTASFTNYSLNKNFLSTGEALNYSLIHLYSISDIHNSPFINRLSFAWEDRTTSKLLMGALDDVLKDTRILVVIGYSFPFFNREVDREIFLKMPMLERVYIQDPNALSIKQNIESVLSDIHKVNRVDISPKGFVNQFFLPPEI